MSLIARIFSRANDRDAMRPLYDAIVAEARAPIWYREGQVPDTIDGRFDMVAALTALVLIRLEAEGEPARRESTLLTEIFIDDMEGSLRQIGIGDIVVGKHVSKLMGALGGRLTSLRKAAAEGDLAPPVRRNIFREAPPSEAAVAWVAARLAQFHARLQGLDRDAIFTGRLA